eukprot:Tbor_TRINITY_DN3267_c0_g2::TRINITY_DN3267_c0_g2_i1::g.23729::m.23729/K03142/TFIIH2, GTF2H2, SSL1; transcription initiation factor TFIIH subunit 2
MIQTCLVIDGSATMGLPCHELPPTNTIGLRPFISEFVNMYLSKSPLALLSAVTMRDGDAHIVAPLTSSRDALMTQLETKYFLVPPSGMMSLENGLKVSLSTLGIDTNENIEQESDTEALTFQRRILVVTGSVSVIDPGDVASFVQTQCIDKHRVKIDIISLIGAPHILAHVSKQTGGTLSCPLSGGGEELAAIFRRLSKLTPFSTETGPCDARIFPVGFPVDAQHSQSGFGCPKCASPVDVPSVCECCGLLICSLPLIHTTFLAINSDKTVPVSTVIPPRKIIGGSVDPILCCSLCSTNFSEGKVSISRHFQCNGCNETRCGTCEETVKEEFGLCPTCIS